MLTKNINFKNFKITQPNKKVSVILKKLLKEDNEILNSLNRNYKNSYTKKTLSKFKNFSEIILIGMGGSILGSR